MPNRSTAILILSLMFVAGLLGWNYVKQPFAQRGESTQVQPSPTPLSSLDKKIESLSVEDKVRLMISVPLTISNSNSNAASGSANTKWIADNHPGAVILFGNQISSSSAQKAIAEIEATYPSTTLPLIVVDHEGGTVQRLNGPGFTKLPTWQSLCNQPAANSAQVLQVSAAELAATGIDVVLAPDVDVASSHAILRSRICSNKPNVVAEHATVYIESFSAEKILPVLKHFPGIGKTSRDLHTNFDRVTIQPDDAGVYKTLLDRFPNIGVMTSHVGVTNQYPDIPCSLSLDCIKELVLNYQQVLVVSDALEMKSASYLPESTVGRTLPEVAIRAVAAGNSLLVFGPTTKEDDLTAVVQVLVTAYDQDELIKNQINRSVGAILGVRERLGKP